MGGYIVNELKFWGPALKAIFIILDLFLLRVLFI